MNTFLPKLKFDKKRLRVKECPCGKSNLDGKFVPYIGHQTNGYCHSCGCTFLPELPKLKNWDDNSASTQHFNRKPVKKISPIKQPSLIPNSIFKVSLEKFESNYFVEFLTNKYGKEITSGLISKYFIGTSNHWRGATIFWQIDLRGTIRTGRIMLFSPITGKRVKEPYNYLNWVHAVLKLPEYNLNQCFFGEHLLHDRTKSVAIFESEKTAIIASLYFQEYICLGAGGKNGLTEQKCIVLKGRNVLLYPDLDAYEIWKSKAKELSHITSFLTSELLEKNKHKIKPGSDLADFLLCNDPNETDINNQNQSLDGINQFNDTLVECKTATSLMSDEQRLAIVQKIITQSIYEEVERRIKER